MPVGGVRIEDDILITSRGYENLTKAPKGNAMFDIIRGNKSTVKTTKPSTASSILATEPHLFRAPGCPLQTPAPALQLLKRATTMPSQSTQEQIGDLERRDHSLGFRRSMTTNERVQYWRQSCQCTSPSRQPQRTRSEAATVCGSSSNAVRHLYIGQNLMFPTQTEDLSQCTNCVILSQTLLRLRQNLEVSEQKSPQQTQEPQKTGQLTHPSPTPTAVAAVHERMHVPVTEAATRTVSGGVQPQSDRVHRGSIVEQRPTHYQNAAFYEADQTQLARLKRRQVPTAIDHQANGDPVVLPFWSRAPQQQERRRASNHTDDRDWMA